MEVLYPYCAGLDVHKETVVACVRRMIGGKVKSEVRTFATMTGSLLELSAWLGSEQVIQSIDKEVEGNLEPFRAAQQLLSAIPGISQLSACVIAQRDRSGHEPLPDCGPSGFLGGPVSAQ